jgi:TetR/AcrR family transcriptional regulator
MNPPIAGSDPTTSTSVSLSNSGSSRSSRPPRPRREEILDEATRLFAERGYEGTSMADLAERVGLRKASLFHHFASKEVLYAAVLARLIEDVGAAIAKGATLEGSYAERLDALGDAVTVVLGEQPFAARLLIREVMDWGPVVRDHLADKIMVVLAASEAFIRAGQADGAFVDTDPRQLIVTLMGVHFMPFAIGGIIERFVGVAPSAPEFIQPRRDAVLQHVRRMVVKNP